MQIPKNCEKLKNWYFLFSIISPILFNLHRHTIPHFKAIEKIFWPLAWGLTLGLISFALFSKEFGNFFMRHPLVPLIIKIFICTIFIKIEENLLSFLDSNSLASIRAWTTEITGTEDLSQEFQNFSRCLEFHPCASWCGSRTLRKNSKSISQYIVTKGNLAYLGALLTH